MQRHGDEYIRAERGVERLELGDTRRARKQLHADRAEWRRTEHGIHELHSHAKRQLYWGDHDHSFGWRTLYRDRVDVQQLVQRPDLHDNADRSWAGDVDAHQQRIGDRSIGADVCDAFGRAHHRDRDGGQRIGIGGFHRARERGWLGDHQLYRDLQPGQPHGNGRVESHHGQWTHERDSLLLHGHRNECFRHECRVECLELGDARGPGEHVYIDRAIGGRAEYDIDKLHGDAKRELFRNNHDQSFRWWAFNCRCTDV